MGMFDDMFSSGRGAGVMGTILGVVVIIGFGSLALFIYDPSFAGGGKTIEGVLKEQVNDITYRKENLESLQRSMKEATIAREVTSQLESITRTTVAREPHLQDSKNTKATLTKEIADLTAEWEKYKQAYRDAESKRAIGEIIPSVSTKDGKTYTNAKFKEVAMNEITIRADAMPTRIQYENMPDEWIDRFQITKELVNKARNATATVVAGHENLTNIAAVRNRITDCNIFIKERNDKVYSMNSELTTIAQKIDNTANELAQYDNMIAQEQGKKGISRVAQYKAARSGVINARNNNYKKRDELKIMISNVQKEIATYKQEVSNLNAKLIELQTPKPSEN